MEPNDMEPIPDDSIFQINEELFWLDRLPKMSARELFDRIHRLFPDHCESVLMLRRLMGEAYRRLNEADALRKENAELRKDKARLDWLATNRVYFQIDHPEDGICVLVSENAAPSGSFGDMSTGDMAALRKVIDAARLAKESEASHE